jgi:hypothetical protein
MVVVLRSTLPPIAEHLLLFTLYIKTLSMLRALQSKGSTRLDILSNRVEYFGWFSMHLRTAPENLYRARIAARRTGILLWVKEADHVRGVTFTAILLNTHEFGIGNALHTDIELPVIVMI